LARRCRRSLGRSRLDRIACTGFGHIYATGDVSQSTLSLHGDNAVAKAREMVESMRQKGDTEGADTWLRIIVAIGTLGTPPTESRH
jgi:hypothetical protein